MNTFYEVFGFVMGICAGIAALALFFTALGWGRRAFGGSEITRVTKVFRADKRLNVHLAGGRILADVQCVGFTDRASAKGVIPYQFSHMAVFETKEGSRIYSRADSIKLIEEIAVHTTNAKS